jgi:hypothetical protein
MTTPDTLIGAVANAIATADVDGATYEDLARAALEARAEWLFGCNAEMMLRADQEDDGA